MVAVDNGWKTQNTAFRVVNDGVNRRITDDMEEFSKMFIILELGQTGKENLVKFHEFFSIHFFCLVERNELDVLGFERLVRERSLDRRQIMRSNSHKSSITSKIRMQLVLKGDERLILSLCEFDAAEDRSSSIRSDFRGLQ